MFLNVFIKVKKHVFYVFYSKINIFIIYDKNKPVMRSHCLDLPMLVVPSVVIPGTDCGSWVFRSADDVEHFVRVALVVDRTALLVVVPLLVLVSRLRFVHHQVAGTFHNEKIFIFTGNVGQL